MLLARGWANEGKVVIGILQLGIVRVNLVDMQWDSFIVEVASN